MKLYRGLKSKDFKPFTRAQEKEMTKKLERLVVSRSRGSFAYPHEMDEEIRELKELERIAVQYFTDKKEIAARYAKDNNGTLVTIDVPEEDILKYFTIEFQNFAKRKKNFELVYRIQGSILREKAKGWQLVLGTCNL